MATRYVVLTNHQEELIARLVESGKFQNASEVLREGLRLLEKEEREFEARLAAFRRESQKGWDDIDAGRYSPITSPNSAPERPAMPPTRVDGGFSPQRLC